MLICSECHKEVNRVYLAIKICASCSRSYHAEVTEGQMSYLQFRVAVTQIYGRRVHLEYAKFLGISGSNFSMVWNGTKRVSKPMRDRLRQAYQVNPQAAKKPVFLIYHDAGAKDPHHILWPNSGLGRQLWLLINQDIPISKAEFLMTFDRLALTYMADPTRGNAFNAEPRQHAWNIAPTIWEGLKNRKVMVMDDDVANIIGYPVVTPEPYMVWREFKDVTFCRMPRRNPLSPYAEEHFPAVKKKLLEVYFDWLSPVK